MILDSECERLVNAGHYDACWSMIGTQVSKLKSAEELKIAGVCALYKSDRDLEIAEKCFEAACEIGPATFWLLYHRAVLFLFTNRPLLAAQCIKDAYLQDPCPLAVDTTMLVVQEAARAEPSVVCEALAILAPILTRLWVNRDADKDVVRSYFKGDSKTLPETYQQSSPDAKSNGYREHHEIEHDLEASVAAFPARSPQRTVFFNSAPKAGTVVLRNILAHLFGMPRVTQFVTKDDIAQRWPFTQYGQTYFIGHVPFTQDGLVYTRTLPMVMLGRDPAGLLTALSRAAYDPRSNRPDHVYARRVMSVEEYMIATLHGYSIDGVTVAPFNEFYAAFVVDWRIAGVPLLTYDDLRAVFSDPRGEPAREVVSAIVAFCASDLPLDWQCRTVAAVGRRISATATPVMSPEETNRLARTAKALVGTHSPQLVEWYQHAQRVPVATRLRMS